MVPPRRILILFFHPLFHKSRVQRKLVQAVQDLEGVTFRNMYNLYPDFHIDVRTEQELLTAHDLIVWQHPLYWYSSPSLLKEWIDLVLEHGFAYGRQGKALEGKEVLSVISTGGREDAYREEGTNRYSLRQLLAPFEQTVTLCNMHYLPPFVVHGTHLLEEDGIARAAGSYREVLEMMRDRRVEPGAVLAMSTLNELIIRKQQD